MTAPLELAFDTETTGFEPGDHRMVEIYLAFYRDGKLLKDLQTYIDPKRSIPIEAQRVHGITPAMLVGKPDWEAVAPKLLPWFAKAEVYIAHNIAFDVRFLEYEFKRVGLMLPKRRQIDTMGLSWATAEGKNPNLKELCIACDVAYDDSQAHAASYDVAVMMECLNNARAWGFGPREESNHTAQAA